MNRSSLTLAAFLCFALTASAKPEIDQPFPDLDSFAIEEMPGELAGKVVLVDFWASWCVPCKASFPAYEALHKEFSNAGLVVIGVGIDNRRAGHDRFLQQNPVTFPTVHDSQKAMVKALQPEAMPTSYLIDRKGVLRHIHVGFQGDKTKNELRQHIQKLLAEAS